MRIFKVMPILAACLLACAAPARANDPTGPQRAFQAHIAYVATFTVPVVIEACTRLDPAYMARAAPAYFGYVNARQDEIERGRLLTLAEFGPEQTLRAYRAHVMDTRLGILKTGTPEQQRGLCEGVLNMLQGDAPSGEWP